MVKSLSIFPAFLENTMFKNAPSEKFQFIVAHKYPSICIFMRGQPVNEPECHLTPLLKKEFLGVVSKSALKDYQVRAIG